MLSTVGQARAFKRVHSEADHFFCLALTEFAKVASHPLRLAEIDQVAIYRALNAVDGRLPHARMLFERALGPDVAMATALASQVEPRYHHHLLLRVLALNPDWYPELIRAYLNEKSRWSNTTIATLFALSIHFYRSLLLHHVQDPDASLWMSHAVSTALAPKRGETLKLIGLGRSASARDSFNLNSTFLIQLVTDSFNCDLIKIIVFGSANIDDLFWI